MLNHDFTQAEKTVVLSDLHLNALHGAFEQIQQQRVCDVLRQEAPRTVVLNGDTLDLFFGRLDGKGDVRVDTILKTNKIIVQLLQKIPNLFILAGAHDQALRWDAGLRQTIHDWFPNCRGIEDGLIDSNAKVVILPGVQWYYDNVVCADGRWLSLTKELTTAFENFILSGNLDANALQSIYLAGHVGFWYRTGSHYEFLKGMSKAFECRIEDYFQRLANLCLSADFAEWAQMQYYEVARSVGCSAPLWAKDGGAAVEELAVPYWKMLGRITRQRFNEYLAAGRLEYPPYRDIAFDTAIVGHTHLVGVYKDPQGSGRRMLFTGSTKPQTRFNGETGIAQNELGGGYAVIDGADVRLERFELEIMRADLRKLAAQYSRKADIATARSTIVL